MNKIKIRVLRPFFDKIGNKHFVVNNEYEITEELHERLKTNEANLFELVTSKAKKSKAKTTKKKKHRK